MKTADTWRTNSTRLHVAMACAAWLLAFASGGLRAQDDKAVHSVEACGECAVTDSRTLADAKQCAFRAAVENALSAAGVERSVVGSTTLQSVQQGEDEALTTFIDASNVAWRGGISGTSDAAETTRIDELGDVVVRHCAMFHVKPYETRPDLSFRFTVEGLQAVYPSPAELTFDVQGPAGCMQAFLLEGDQAYRFFPNDTEPKSCRPDGFHNTAFPDPESQRKYELFHEPGIDGPWMLVFVFTKKDCAAAVPATWAARELLFWIESMEPEERDVKMHPFGFGL